MTMLPKGSERVKLPRRSHKSETKHQIPSKCYRFVHSTEQLCLKRTWKILDKAGHTDTQKGFPVYISPLLCIRKNSRQQASFSGIHSPLALYKENFQAAGQTIFWSTPGVKSGIVRTFSVFTKDLNISVSYGWRWTWMRGEKGVECSKRAAWQGRICPIPPPPSPPNLVLVASGLTKVSARRSREAESRHHGR